MGYDPGVARGSGGGGKDLLVTNRKLALGFTVGFAVPQQVMDGLDVQHAARESGVVLGVLVARIDLTVVGQTSERVVEGRVHLLRRAFEKPPASLSTTLSLAQTWEK